MIIDTSEFAKNGGLELPELEIFDSLNYDLLNLPEFKHFKFEITNAIHLIQCLFMWRVMIRLSEGKFWMKYNLPCENNTKLEEISIPEKYKYIINNYLDLFAKFKKLEAYHPSHLDDFRRGVNQLIGIINSI